MDFKITKKNDNVLYYIFSDWLSGGSWLKPLNLIIANFDHSFSRNVQIDYQAEAKAFKSGRCQFMLFFQEISKILIELKLKLDCCQPKAVLVHFGAQRKF